MTLYGVTGLLAQQQVTQENPTGQGIKFILMMVLFMVVMFVLTSGSQRKKNKETEAMLKNLRNGDKIVTSSGIVGMVVGIKEKSVSIRSADTKLEVLKSSVTEVTEKSGEAAETKS